MICVDSEHDASDDDTSGSCFYIGEEEDGFSASKSVYDSDMTEDGSEDGSEGDDDSYWYEDNECDDGSLDESVGNGSTAEDFDLDSLDSDLDSLDNVSFYIGERDGLWSEESLDDDGIVKTRIDAAADGGDDWFLDSEYAKESEPVIAGLNWLLDSKRVSEGFDKSVATGLTAACSDVVVHDLRGTSECASVEDEYENDLCDESSSFDGCVMKGVDESSNDSVGTGLTMISSDSEFIKFVSFCSEKEEGFFISDDIHESDISMSGSNVDDDDRGDDSLFPNEHVGNAYLMRPVVAEPNSSRKNEEPCPTSSGESYGDALERILSRSLLLMALITAPSWPMIDLAEVMPDL